MSAFYIASFGHLLFAALHVTVAYMYVYVYVVI
jgi:hypothetical protein